MSVSSISTTPNFAPPVQIYGLSSGLDSQTIIQDLVNIQSGTLNAYKADQTQTLNVQAAYNTLAGKLKTLEAATQVLSTPLTFSAVMPTVANPSILSASATSDASMGVYNVNVQHVSTASWIQSTGAIGAGGSGVATNLSALPGIKDSAGGNSGTGSIVINGATIGYNLATDTIGSLLGNINNNSAAGVTATYDSATDTIILNNNANGAGNIPVTNPGGADQSNLADVLNLSVAVTNPGQQAQIQINNGSPITSNNDTFTPAQTGITGLTITAAQVGTTQISMGGNTSVFQTDINNFVSAYNDVMNYITSQSTTTNANGAVQTGPFTGDLGIQNLENSLRSIISQEVTGLPSGLNYLGGIGIGPTGQSPTISITNSSKLTSALTNNLPSVQSLFTDPIHGIMTQLSNALLNATANPNGLIQNEANTISSKLSTLQNSINQQTQYLQAYQQQLTNSFANMEILMGQYNNSGLSTILNGLLNGLNSVSQQTSLSSSNNSSTSSSSGTSG